MRRYDDSSEIIRELWRCLTEHSSGAIVPIRLRGDPDTTVFLPSSDMAADGYTTVRATFRLSMTGLATHISYLEYQARNYVPDSYFTENQRMDLIPGQRVQRNDVINTMYR